MILLYSLTLFLLPDKERLLTRAHNSLKETNGFLMSYQNSIRFDRTHHRLSQMIHKLQQLEQEFDYMLNPR